MKHSHSIMVMIALSIVLLAFSSCQKAEKASDTWYLTGIDSSNVVREISQALDALLSG